MRSDISSDDFLNEGRITPARSLKWSLYLLMISVGVGLGHLSKLELRSLD